MKEWQNRVLEERNALDEKITKLEAFLNSDLGHGIPEEDRNLLLHQSDAMATYLSVLVERIKRFNASDVDGSGDCSCCVHGHQIDDLIACGPKHVAHDPDFRCSGFRRVTQVEIDERVAAFNGLPR